MDIEIQAHDGYHLAKLSGELGAADTDVLSQELHALIAPRETVLVVDLADLKTIDSSGLSQLISLTTHARLSESRVILVGPSSFVAGVFEMTRLDRWFEIVANFAEAEQLFRRV